MTSSRDDNWKAQYLKLVEYKEAHGTTKVSRTENYPLYVWCYNQRKKFRDSHPTLTDEKISLLNDIDFGWDITSIPGRGRPQESNDASNATSKAMGEIKRQKKEKTKDLEAVTVEEKPSEIVALGTAVMVEEEEDPTEIAAPVTPPRDEDKERTSLTALDSRQLAAAVALVAADDDDDDAAAEDMVVVDPPPPTPNMGFLKKSIGGAAWIADGAKSLLKMFVAF